VCEHTRLLCGRRFVLFIIIFSLIVHVKGNERVKKKDFSSSYPHSRWQERREKRDMIYIFNRRSDCHHCLSYTLIIFLLLLPGVFFSIDERKASSKHSMNREWMRAQAYTTYGVLNCVKSCLGWWLFTSFSLSHTLVFHPPEILIRQHLLNDTKKGRRKRQRWRWRKRRRRMNT
jgi:hypothetical protein